MTEWTLTTGKKIYRSTVSYYPVRPTWSYRVVISPDTQGIKTVEDDTNSPALCKPPSYEDGFQSSLDLHFEFVPCSSVPIMLRRGSVFGDRPSLQLN